MPQMDHDLAAALKRARTNAMNFALLLRAPNDGTLIVSWQPITSKTIADARDDLNRCEVYKGRCVGAGPDQYLFETEEEPPGNLAKWLRTIISRSAGLTVRIEARKAADPAENKDQGGADPNATAPATTQDDPATTLAKEAVRKRLVALAAPFKELAVGDGPEAQRLDTLLGAITAFVGKQDFVRANQGLDLMERLLADGQAAKKVPAAK